MQPNEIVSRFDSLVAARKNVEGTWNIINKYVVPFRGDFFSQITSESAVNWHENRLIYDSTAVNSANLLSSNLHGSLTSPATRWFDFLFHDDDLNDDHDAREWLEECSKRVYKALQDSNFNLEANETYLDLVSYGTSVIVEETEEDPSGGLKHIVFQSVPIEEVQFEQGYKGNVHTFFRRYKWTAIQIVDKFGEAGVPLTIIERTKTHPDEKLDVILCIYCRKGKDKNLNSDKKLAPKQRPYAFKHILRIGMVELGKEGGYYEMPAFVPRWRKTNKSMWGNSPAMAAMPDILTINKLVELILKSTEKVVDPTTKVTERGLLSDLDLTPGGMTVVRSMDDMQPYESKARFDVSQLQREKLQQAIERAFFVDQLQLKESPAMTATEVQTRYELMQRLLGPTLGRLESDFLDPLVQRTFNILLRAGMLPTVPEVVKAARAEMNIAYIGPLSRAQKSDVATSITEWVGTIGMLAKTLVEAQYPPDILDIPDYDKIAKELGQLKGAPTKLLKSDRDLKKTRKERQDHQVAMAAAERAKAQGEAMQAGGAGLAAINPAAQPQQGAAGGETIQ